MEFNTVSISDGITMGSAGMRASLVSREVIADSIELVARGNLFDAIVDSGRLRQDHPGRGDGARAARHPRPDSLRRLDRAGTVPGARRHHSGRVRGGRRARRRADVRRRLSCELEDHACPGAGACGGQFTANTMATVVRVPRHRADGQRRRAGDRRGKAGVARAAPARW